MKTARPLLATYRIQFNAEFRFAEARQAVAYLERLGVTHLYSSPVLRARSGSLHGYDTIDPRRLNPALGSDADFRGLIADLHGRGMGLLLDIVPNHMAASSENPYWQDVLAYGPASPYARWFDIEWRSPDPELWGRVVVPVLGDRLPKVLADGQLTVEWAEGRFRVRYFEHVFPVDPATVPMIVLFGIDDLHRSLDPEDSALVELPAILKRLRRLPRRAARMRRRRALPRDETEELLTRFAGLVYGSPRMQDWAVRTCRSFAEGPDGARRMQSLLAAQSHRLAHWRRAARILNYRRFFDINDLISVRQEDPEVFFGTHALILDWVREGLLDGLRIDHLDGLRDPRGYLLRLGHEVAQCRTASAEPPPGPLGQPGAETPAREEVAGTAVGAWSVVGHGRQPPGEGPEPSRDASPFPVFVEKILAPGERLPEDWPVAGTTGYEFLNDLESLFLSPEGYDEIEHQYRRMLGRPIRFHEVVAWGKRRVLKAELSAFVGRLAEVLHRLARQHPDTEPLTLRELVEAVVEIAVCLPVYRTYIDARRVLDEHGRHYLEAAVDAARERQRATPEAIEFLRRVLLLENLADLPENEQQERLTLIERFQQLTGPAAAKGVEDTALYVHVPLVARNEVGGEPDVSLDDAPGRLHQANRERAEHWPRNLLCVTTHDTKRSADVRSRLDVLSELPKLWSAHVARWRRWNRPHRRRVGGRTAPDPNTEYLLYQTLVGIWPAPARRNSDESLPPDESEAAFPDAAALEELRGRVEEYMLKAAREGKVRTSWVDAEPGFEEGLASFTRSILTPTDDAPSRFLSDVNQFVARIARPGFWNALARLVVHLTAPGVPDLYQGDELWNFSLVDPDNRRPVDYDLRRRLLEEVIAGWERPPEARAAFVRGLVADPEDGRIKLHAARRTLGARRQCPDLFLHGGYEPLVTTGPAGDRVFAFSRCCGEDAALVVVPRLTAALRDDPAAAPLGESAWSGTELRLPDRLRGRHWECALTGAAHRPEAPSLPVAVLFQDFPAAVLLASRD